MGVAYVHPDLFLLMHPDFSRLSTPTSYPLSEMLRNIGNSRAMEEVIFFSLVHPGALSARFGVTFAPSHLLLLGMVRISGHLLQVSKSDL